jgi:hypothetical protein
VSDIDALVGEIFVVALAVSVGEDDCVPLVVNEALADREPCADRLSEDDPSFVVEPTVADDDRLSDIMALLVSVELKEPVREWVEERLPDTVSVRSFVSLWLMDHSDAVTLPVGVADAASFVKDVLPVLADVAPDTDLDCVAVLDLLVLPTSLDAVRDSEVLSSVVDVVDSETVGPDRDDDAVALGGELDSSVDADADTDELCVRSLLELLDQSSVALPTLRVELAETLCDRWRESVADEEIDFPVVALQDAELSDDAVPDAEASVVPDGLL